VEWAASRPPTPLKYKVLLNIKEENEYRVVFRSYAYMILAAGGRENEKVRSSHRVSDEDRRTFEK
jgi:hypothetical protein